MKITEMSEVENLLQEMKYFFSSIDIERDKLEKELVSKELERDDLLHEIELASLNAIEIVATYSKLRKVLKERRNLKDDLDLINTIRGYTSKLVTKGICAETNILIENIEKLKENKQNRTYRPRILKDLKCAKKEG